MSKKIALVTGVNKGIGFTTVQLLAQQNITVLAAARNKEKTVQAIKPLQDKGLDVHFIQLDVSNTQQIADAFEYINATYGRLDILINNAGIQIESDNWNTNNSGTINIAALKETFNTNFFGLIELTNSLLPLIKKSNAGRIVNLSSILGSLHLHATPGSPIYGSKLLAYNSSKTALNAYTVHLANALEADGIKVNSAHPGWVKTDMGGEIAPMNVEDGAATSVQLALLPADGPTGKFIHLGEELPW
jgi:NAD(P)-dependent dehydrogenase (short-subunit alcohol dehydrogenase family)